MQNENNAVIEMISVLQVLGKKKGKKRGKQYIKKQLL